MSALRLRFWGVRARVECACPEVLEALARDFEYFLDDAGPAGADVELLLEATAPGAWAACGLPLFRGPGYAALATPAGRLVRYEDAAAALYDYARRRGRLACARPSRLHELAYLALLSRVGEELDRRGLHRVHALGFSWDGQGAALLLPSGGGKTTLTLELLRRGRARLLSEDTPLIDAQGLLRAFPLRLGLRPDADLSSIPAEFRRPIERRRHGPKTAVDLAFFRGRVEESAPARWLLLGSRRGGAPSLTRAGGSAALAALGVNLVAGWGVAQMAEYTLRASGAPSLAAVAWRRSLAAAALARRCEVWRFELGDDAGEAARALERFLDGAAVRKAAAL